MRNPGLPECSKEGRWFSSVWQRMASGVPVSFSFAVATLSTTMAASCSDFTLTGVFCAGLGARLNKTSTTLSYADGRAATAAPVHGIGVTTPAMNSHYVRVGLSASSTSSSPTFGAALFPRGLACTGWDSCDSYAANLGPFGEGDEVTISEDDSGAISLRHNGTLLRRSAAGAARGSWYGIVAFYDPGSWVESVQLEWPMPSRPPQPPSAPPPPRPPSVPPSSPVPPGIPDSSPPLVRAMPRSALDKGQIELLAAMCDTTASNATRALPQDASCARSACAGRWIGRSMRESPRLLTPAHACSRLLTPATDALPLTRRRPLSLPIEYPANETVHREREMYGYAPRFMPNYVSFDAFNRPWILANLPMAESSNGEARPAVISSATCYVDGNCDGSRSASRGWMRVLLQTLDDVGQWRAVDVGDAALAAGVPGTSTGRVQGGTFIDQSVHPEMGGEVYVAANLEGAGGVLMFGSMDSAAAEPWQFVRSFWASLQLDGALLTPVGLQFTTSTSTLSLVTGARTTWTSTAVYVAAAGESLFWSDAKSHAGGASAAYVRRGPNGEPLCAFVVYATTKPAPAEEVEAWYARYNESNLEFARVAAGPSAMPGTAHHALQYNFTSNALDGAAPHLCRHNAQQHAGQLRLPQCAEPCR